MSQNEIPTHIKDAVFRVVLNDLEPRPEVVAFKTGIAAAAGGLASLFFCGQFGMGFGLVADSVYQWIMANAGMLGCTLLCGSLFAILPVIVLRLISSAIQFRIVVTKKWPVLFVWFSLIGIYMYARNEGRDSFWEVLAWIASAIVAFKILAHLADHLTVSYQRLRFRYQA